MNTKKNDHKEKDGAWKAVHEALNTEVPEHLEKQLQKTLNAFRQDMREHPYVRRLKRPGFPLGWKLILSSRPWVRPFLLAGMGLAVVFIAGFLILGNNPPTWAQVQERFGSMSYFTLSIYKRDITRPHQTESETQIDPIARPKLIEVWGGHGNRVRIRSGSKVTFVDKGEILNTFDLTTRSETYADASTYEIINAAGNSNTNLFDWLLMPFTSDLFPELTSKEWKSGGLVDTTSLVISDPVASKDLVVFDHDFYYFKTKTGKARVWALRESRLPIRILIWPMDGFNGRLVRSPKWDMILTYSIEQPKQFFDPKAFAAKLKDPAIDIESLLYMFHQYPGGDPNS